MKNEKDILAEAVDSLAKIPVADDVPADVAQATVKALSKVKAECNRENNKRHFTIERIRQMKIYTKIAVAAAIVCAACFGLFLFTGNGQTSLYAQVVETLESTTSLHYTIEKYSDGAWGKFYETWYDINKGYAEYDHPNNRYQVKIDNGEYLWRYNPGSDFIVRSVSVGPKSHHGRFVSGNWSNTRMTRKPEGDKTMPLHVLSQSLIL